MATPIRDAPRRRSSRQALAIIPDTTISNSSPLAVGATTRGRESMEPSKPAPSPDELVIQKRGRRSMIVWSPEADGTKRESIFSDRTPGKTPKKKGDQEKQDKQYKNTPRKKLNLGEDDIEMLSEQPRVSPKPFTGELINGLKGLSKEQLIKMLMDLIQLEEDQGLEPNNSLREIVMKNMPVADIQPLKERLSSIRQNISASLVSSNEDEPPYTRAVIHLDNFQKAIMEHTKMLTDSQHWSATIQYIFAAWSITRDLPEWKNNGVQSERQRSFKLLADTCYNALEEGKFSTNTLNIYKEKLKTYVGDYDDINRCIQFIKKASA
ncbi:uncharacterized protein LOC106657555 isoform X1 [Trichogramma pretiosum]|uniref:uncharacterized protein LOC106657555 isoform X1 n=1 Tax=Trichogramma pretiosum TaxID=7493 RepID=UPI0006C9632E|nr:uncharacterized protein LOC106657555 isoform X1 [Trichogramma pretiosum]XP_014234630.1 uncharacterized protein LOC106657555 isoform X1 [Trichogramma pretiosum]XP_023317837.1 uncharacterized protein LOC106657555 isoform X1 [Trichogramma pretiosum]